MPAQYAWHEQERIMFLCLGVPTWLGTEYDTDGEFDLSGMNFAGVDADAICLTAKSWGAKDILLVASHVGGFYWWPTTTTEYCVRNTPWRGGKGDLVQELAGACRRHRLSIGIYLYSDSPRFTKAIGASGKTDDPEKQAEWSRLFRQQWEEALTICGKDLVREVWLDGGQHHRPERHPEAPGAERSRLPGQERHNPLGRRRGRCGTGSQLEHAQGGGQRPSSCRMSAIWPKW